ncbi:MAG: hypothetical protein GYB67_09545 [Chloroflexi bacterium]|nr:hypothetical protein [Chloroflexota bacterium]
MMTRLILRLIPLSVAPLVVIFGLIRLQPARSALEELFADSANCAALCVLGLEPGVTTLGDLDAALRVHPWVADVRYNRAPATDSGLISWAWSGAQPAVIDARRQGLASIQDGVLAWVELPTTIAIGELWLLAPPSTTRASIAQIQGRRHAIVSGRHFDGALSAGVTVPCPVRSAMFWRAAIRMWVIVPEPPMPGEPTAQIDLPTWGGCP